MKGKRVLYKKGKKEGRAFLTEVKFSLPPLTQQKSERELKIFERKATFSISEHITYFPSFIKSKNILNLDFHFRIMFLMLLKSTLKNN
jgi:hypothetical protein